MISSRFFIGFGLTLMLMGIILPFLMVIKVLESTFLLNFISSGASTFGLALGTIGFAIHRGKNNPEGKF